VVFPPHEQEPAKFLAARSVRADHVVSSPLSGLQIRGTPTLLLVDAKGEREMATADKLSLARALVREIAARLASSTA
jgi:hypothetical protein